jgi:hypothetical protein
MDIFPLQLSAKVSRYAMRGIVETGLGKPLTAEFPGITIINFSTDFLSLLVDVKNTILRMKSEGVTVQVLR